MNILNKFCTQAGHYRFELTHVCKFENCNVPYSRCCIQCIKEGIHNHGQSDHEHIRLKQQIQNINQLKFDMQEGQNKKIKLIDFKKIKYKLKQKDYFEGTELRAQISNNEKYFVYGGSEKILKIFDLKEDKIIKEIKFHGQIFSCQFTNDSLQLYVGFSNYTKAAVVGYFVQKNFKKTFQLNIHTNYIIDIIPIQNQCFITCGYDGSVMKTNIKRKKQLFSLKVQDNWTKTFDYDYSNDLMISGTAYKSIQLWGCCKRSLIIHKKQAHPADLFQIQFINNIQNVLSLDYQYHLFKWKIDLINNQLIKIQVYKDPNNIYSFQQINQNQNLLLICNYYVKIIDCEGETIIQIDHQCNYRSHFLFQNKHLDNARYIMISNFRQIMLASALE